jgi:hypothetical protein
MKSKHTPGPWFVVNEAIYRRPKKDLYQYGGSVAGDMPLATVSRGWYGDAHGYPVEANAQLIAAAPELLVCLKAAMAFIKSHAADPDLTDEMCDKYAVLQELKPESVINKAEGRT